MIIHKYFKYRVYPSEHQIARLERWDGALRFLWNIAHEQRLMALSRPKGEQPLLSAFQQITESTGLRQTLPWLADVPRAVGDEVLFQLDKAWRQCFDKQTGRPRFKTRKYRLGSFTETHKASWRIDGNELFFAKLGKMPIVLHRAMEGDRFACTLKQSGGKWFACIGCKHEIPDPVRRTEPVVGLDRGLRNFVADSNGVIMPNPEFLRQMQRKLAHAERAVRRKEPGSANRRKAWLRVQKLYAKTERQRDHFLHQLSTIYASQNAIAVIENLPIQQMQQNPWMAYRIGDAGWGTFARMLAYKLRNTGGELIETPAPYTSRTCAQCGHEDRDSRYREIFLCTACGHEDHADVNAAKILKSRASRSVKPVEGKLPEGTRRSRKGHGPWKRSTTS